MDLRESLAAPEDRSAAPVSSPDHGATVSAIAPTICRLEFAIARMLVLPTALARTSPATESTVATLVSLVFHKNVACCRQGFIWTFARSVSPGCTVAEGGETLRSCSVQSTDDSACGALVCLQPAASIATRAIEHKDLIILSTYQRPRLRQCAPCHDGVNAAPPTRSSSGCGGPKQPRGGVATSFVGNVMSVEMASPSAIRTRAPCAARRSEQLARSP